MADSRIHNSLQQLFQRHRLVFWYDCTCEWAEVFKAYPDTSLTELTVMGNEFGTKVRIVRDPHDDSSLVHRNPTPQTSI